MNGGMVSLALYRTVFDKKDIKKMAYVCIHRDMTQPLCNTPTFAGQYVCWLMSLND